ncbi:biotin/lipoyl-binding protein [Clostridium sp. D2Q-11]|uniref:Biotin/lipoyl-binding protein n=1 Tax=Anaeromonas frigoriresistens TaxID=2683708 RepID=A0A942Z838_9FIRM|nr:biotin/lipoyl-containing protein [Anaeromonas frigoriresistens]MBS4537564.1 biotin/lipoyl-binding protein [Anaeromonas frigoriresistens]
MKKYNITVNGNTYEVEVEEVGASSEVSRPKQVTTEVKKPAPKAQPKPQPKKEEKPSQPAPKAVPQGAETISAPMPGSVFDIKVNEGDTVAEGDVLLILEAMKMENEIMAPRAGKVAAINTSKGAAVNSGDPLISLE